MTATKPEIVFPETAEHALRVKCKYSRNWEQWIWIQSDLHWDSPEWQRKLYHRHAKMALERDALFVDLGDRFDVIGGRSDPRATKGSIRSEHNRSAYLDVLIDDAVEEFRPYAQNMIYEGEGNHEAAILKRCETNITSRFVEKMSAVKGERIYRAGYDGWIVFYFEHEGGGRQQSIAAKLHHGHGGGGEVTKGVIQEHRAAAATESYGIYASGHVHEQYMLKHMVEGLNAQGRVKTFERQHIRVGSYKADFRTDGKGTWHMMRGGRAKPLGGAFVKFYCPEAYTVAFTVEYPHVNYDSLE